jgi:hypothetical protein
MSCGTFWQNLINYVRKWPASRICKRRGSTLGVISIKVYLWKSFEYWNIRTKWNSTMKIWQDRWMHASWISKRYGWIIIHKFELLMKVVVVVAAPGDEIMSSTLLVLHLLVSPPKCPRLIHASLWAGVFIIINGLAQPTLYSITSTCPWYVTGMLIFKVYFINTFWQKWFLKRNLGLYGSSHCGYFLFAMGIKLINCYLWWNNLPTSEIGSNGKEKCPTVLV